jgi:hypothetical protein
VFLHIVWVEIPFLVRLFRRLCEAPGKTRDEGGAFSPACGRFAILVSVYTVYIVQRCLGLFVFKMVDGNGKAVLLV